MTKAALWQLVLVLLIVAGGGCEVLQSEKDAPITDPVTAWQTRSPGIAYRTLPVNNAPAEFEMHVVRIDPSLVRWQVHYEPGTAYSYLEWADRLEPDVKVFINANFFTEVDIAIGLVVADGLVSGSSLPGYGGMFQIDVAGTPRVRSLVTEPYVRENLQHAVQSFPMLIEPGGVPASTGAGFDDPARRSAIAQDTNGYIYLFNTGLLGQISLRNLQNWLLNSGLGLNIAFALDGGRSAMLFVNGANPVDVAGLASVPVILAVY